MGIAHIKNANSFRHAHITVDPTHKYSHKYPALVILNEA